MKKSIVATVMLLALPLVSFAAGSPGATGKNLCLLDSAYCSCLHQTGSLPETVTELARELDREDSPYSTAERTLLQAKLHEHRHMLRDLGRR